jgi:type II secretory pathway pseudopilin PulG
MKSKRTALTLIEMMLVIILIGIVGGALAFNLKGAIEKGKGFKTEEIRKKIDSVLDLALLEGTSLEELEENWMEYVKKSPLIKVKPNQESILDGWGKPFRVEVNPQDHSLVVISDHTPVDEEEHF